MTFASALEWIAASRERGVQPGLSRTARLLSLLGNPQDTPLMIHVAGTNGKGSVCACLEAALRACGHRTGMFTSPWLLDVREMFRVDGQPVSEARFAEGVTAVAKASREMVDSPGLPTEYELYAAIAFWLFREAACQVVVLETCMGGRFDTTNAYAGDNLAVLTSISLDHTRFLGDTLDEIAWHKAGIFRSKCQAISSPQAKVVAEVLCRCAEQTETELRLLPARAVSDIHVDVSRTQFHVDFSEMEEVGHPSRCVEGPDLTERTWSGAYAVSLTGEHQAENAALALTSLLLLHRWKPELALTPDAIRSGLCQVRWPCRFEVFSGTPDVVVDGAHNPDGMRHFVQTFRRVFPDRQAIVIFGVLRDKDVAGMLDVLREITVSIHLIAPESPRAMPVAELEALVVERLGCTEAGYGDGQQKSDSRRESGCCAVHKHDTIQTAMEAGLQETGPKGVLVAVGSLSWTGFFRRMVLDRIIPRRTEG